MKQPELLFGCRVQVGLAEICHGFAMTASLHCFDNEQPCCVACFKHRGEHYHIGMQCLPGRTPEEMAAVVAGDPHGAIRHIASTFLSMSVEDRKTYLANDKDHQYGA